MGRIYNVLSNLEEYSLIRIQDSRPRRYACVEMQAQAEELTSELAEVRAKNQPKTFWTVAV